MNTATRVAIEKYREATKLECKEAIATKVLSRAVRHPDLEMPAYIKATFEIDQAKGEFIEAIERNDWAESTMRQTLSHALREAGRV